MLTKDMTQPKVAVDEDGLIDLDNEEVLRSIAGGISEAPTILDNKCITNQSACGTTKPPA